MNSTNFDLVVLGIQCAEMLTVPVWKEPGEELNQLLLAVASSSRVAMFSSPLFHCYFISC